MKQAITLKSVLKSDIPVIDKQSSIIRKLATKEQRKRIAIKAAKDYLNGKII